MTLAASAVTADSTKGFVLIATTAPICVAAALGGPVAGALVALIGSTERRELRRGFPWYGLVGNHAELVLAAFAAGSPPRSSGQRPILDRRPDRRGRPLGGGDRRRVHFRCGRRDRPAGGGPSAPPTVEPRRDSIHYRLPEHGADVAIAVLVAVMYTSGAWWLTLVFLVPIVSVVIGARRYKVAWQADHDPLTGTVLRRELDRQLATILAAASGATGWPASS